MDRTDFLKLCQKASISDASKCFVKNEKIVYKPYGYEMTFEKGIPRHTAILKDLKANSLTYAKLETVEISDEV